MQNIPLILTKNDADEAGLARRCVMGGPRFKIGLQAFFMKKKETKNDVRTLLPMVSPFVSHFPHLRKDDQILMGEIS